MFLSSVLLLEGCSKTSCLWGETSFPALWLIYSHLFLCQCSPLKSVDLFAPIPCLPPVNLWRAFVLLVVLNKVAFLISSHKKGSQFLSASQQPSSTSPHTWFHFLEHDLPEVYTVSQMVLISLPFYWKCPNSSILVLFLLFIALLCLWPIPVDYYTHVFLLVCDFQLIQRNL